MNQRKTTSNPSDAHTMEEKRATALQQYQDTEGHFSLVRCSGLGLPLELLSLIGIFSFRRHNVGIFD